ncbi:MAG TPA: type II toxin-antitoxin system RelE/ParE family toxin [Thermoanaerobaculia bacterium]|nr:type II toxin-antitoxin system RelE/ParE family toxin [Thermoanaerobaculia bacterium]
MTRIIEWRPRAIKDLDRLSPEIARRVRAAVERLREGEGDVRRLQDVDPPLFRLRVGDLRVLFEHSEEHAIVIRRVLPRDKAYR